LRAQAKTRGRVTVGFAGVTTSSLLCFDSIMGIYPLICVVCAAFKSTLCELMVLRSGWTNPTQDRD
jgi:hypothetical protein